jgi:glutathione S-transferase
MPQYKLTYFNLRARAEVPRFLFALAGVEYEDNRIELSDWPKCDKESLGIPFGQLPILSIDGVVYCQSLCIARYLAEKFGYAGKTDLDKLRGDMIAHCVEDVVVLIAAIRKAENPETKERLRKKFKEEELHPTCEQLEKLLKQNGGGDGYFVGDSLTWADLIVYQHLTSYIPVVPVELLSFIDDFPKLKALVDKVEKHPKIAAWIAKRPVTEY